MNTRSLCVKFLDVNETRNQGYKARTLRPANAACGKLVDQAGFGGRFGSGHGQQALGPEIIDRRKPALM